MKERTKFHVGLDVHKDSISVAAAELGRAPARLIGKVTHDLNKLLKVLTKLGSAEELHIVYEAGPTGFGLQRALKERGYLCEIIAPSQIPRRSGDRVNLTGSCFGQLAPWMPDPGDEAIRNAAAGAQRLTGSGHGYCRFKSSHNVAQIGEERPRVVR